MGDVWEPCLYQFIGRDCPCDSMVGVAVSAFDNKRYYAQAKLNDRCPVSFGFAVHDELALVCSHYAGVISSVDNQ